MSFGKRRKDKRSSVITTTANSYFFKVSASGINPKADSCHGLACSSNQNLTFREREREYYPSMEKCIYRIPVEAQNNKGIAGAMDKAIDNPFVHTAVSGQLRQSFKNGLCALLTQNDMGPVACLQPDHSEKTCPDIADLRSQTTT